MYSLSVETLGSLLAQLNCCLLPCIQSGTEHWLKVIDLMKPWSSCPDLSPQLLQSCHACLEQENFLHMQVNMHLEWAKEIGSRITGSFSRQMKTASRQLCRENSWAALFSVRKLPACRYLHATLLNYLNWCCYPLMGNISHFQTSHKKLQTGESWRSAEVGLPYSHFHQAEITQSAPGMSLNGFKPGQAEACQHWKSRLTVPCLDTQPPKTPNKHQFR